MSFFFFWEISAAKLHDKCRMSTRTKSDKRKQPQKRCYFRVAILCLEFRKEAKVVELCWGFMRNSSHIVYKDARHTHNILSLWKQNIHQIFIIVSSFFFFPFWEAILLLHPWLWSVPAFLSVASGFASTLPRQSEANILMCLIN